jgi:hypothetical protein
MIRSLRSWEILCTINSLIKNWRVTYVSKYSKNVLTICIYNGSIFFYLIYDKITELLCLDSLVSSNIIKVFAMLRIISFFLLVSNLQ